MSNHILESTSRDSSLAARSSLRILTVADVPPDPNSGAAGTVYHTNRALRELGHEVDEVWADDLGPRRISHGNLHSLIEQPRSYRREVLKATANIDYDVVMMSQPQAYLAAKSLRNTGFTGKIVNRSHGLELRVDTVVPRWHKKLGVPESRFPQSLGTPLLRSLLQRQWTKVMQVADRIVVPCDMDREFLLNRYRVPPQFVRTIHHGVSESILSAPLAKMSEIRQRAVLHVGQFAFFKGPHLVAQIMNRVFDGTSDISLTWVTSKSGCEHAKALIDPRHEGRVEFVPWTTQEELVRIYDRHGVFLFPTLCEGAAKSSLEAMARGLCVVGSDDSGMRDYITHGVNGFLCPVGDVDRFAADVLKAVQTPNAAAISKAAAAYAREKTWAKCASLLQQLFTEGN